VVSVEDITSVIVSNAYRSIAIHDTGILIAGVTFQLFRPQALAEFVFFCVTAPASATNEFHCRNQPLRGAPFRDAEWLCSWPARILLSVGQRWHCVFRRE
jgi:hypothetical protein